MEHLLSTTGYKYVSIFFLKKKMFVLIIKNLINHKFYHYTFSLSNEYRIFRAMCKYGAWKT